MCVFLSSVSLPPDCLSQLCTWGGFGVCMHVCVCVCFCVCPWPRATAARWRATVMTDSPASPLTPLLSLSLHRLLFFPLTFISMYWTGTHQQFSFPCVDTLLDLHDKITWKFRSDRVSSMDGLFGQVLAWCHTHSIKHSHRVPTSKISL